jgi:ABC-type phosphate transport system auxiliary subunit
MEYLSTMSYPDKLERWLLERFRLRASLRSAWEAYRVVNERENVTIKKLRKELEVLRQHVPLKTLTRLHDEGKIDKWYLSNDLHAHLPNDIHVYHE